MDANHQQRRPGHPDGLDRNSLPHSATPGGWSGPIGYDAELRRHNEVLRQACGVKPNDHVLDIGCGAGQTTRQAAWTWQAREHNEWEVAIEQSITRPEATPAHASEEPGPFSLADPSTVREILEAVGFADITFTDVREPVYYGPDVTAALDWVRGFTSTDHVLRRLDPGAAARTLGRLREALAQHVSADGVWFNSRAWIVTARRHVGPIAG